MLDKIIRKTLRGMRTSQMDKILTLYLDQLRSMNFKRDDNLSCIEGKVGLKDIHGIAQNAPLFVSLL